jgi:hypothetical protein
MAERNLIIESDGKARVAVAVTTICAAAANAEAGAFEKFCKTKRRFAF